MLQPIGIVKKTDSFNLAAVFCHRKLRAAYGNKIESGAAAITGSVFRTTRCNVVADHLPRNCIMNTSIETDLPHQKPDSQNI